jgi:MFS family permease
MALGPIVGGVFITIYGEQDGVRLAFVVAFVLGLVALVLQQVMIEEVKETQKGETNPLRVLGFLSADLRNLLVSDILVRFCEQIPYAFVVIWAVSLNGITPVQFGLLTAIEMVTAMIIYIPVAYLVGKSTKKPFVAMTFGFFTVFPLVLLYSRSFTWFVIAFIVRGLKEFGEPTRKSLIMDLAPEGKKASVFGLYYLIRDVIVSFAAFGGALLWEMSPETNFLVAFGFGILGTLYFIAFGRDLIATQ